MVREVGWLFLGHFWRLMKWGIIFWLKPKIKLQTQVKLVWISDTHGSGVTLTSLITLKMKVCSKKNSIEISTVATFLYVTKCFNVPLARDGWNFIIIVYIFFWLIFFVYFCPFSNKMSSTSFWPFSIQKHLLIK